ncbi:MAG TPA: HD domain-containing protein, partial [Burkholderiaceae bacterium]|nr:HD domain-containing protein [Burkholderiaceae bacterium]
VHELRRMNDVSILGRYLPVFRRIVGQMQHDLFHVYTVDQHILTVIRNVRRFTMAEHAHEYPFCSQLMANFERHWLLYVAALFHDIAKGRGGDHSVLGKVEVRRFARDHGLSAEDNELLEFLVEHHLTMSQVAQKKDLSDPQVITDFARLVGTERRLTALYLLTVADIRGTSPKVWNAWKGKLLEDLFHLTRRALGAEGVVQAFQPNAELAARQQEARRILRLYAFSDTVHEELWKQLDVAFFLRQDPKTIAWLTRSLHYQVNAQEPVVKARPALVGDGMQVAVYVRDQPDLFARLCGYFDGKRYSILDAKVHTTRHGYALDTFIVTDTNSTREALTDYRALSPIVERDLVEVISEATPLPEPVQARISRQSRHFPIQPRVELLPDERGQYYLLSVTAADRSGLLYAIARVLTNYKIAVHTAKIMTLGDRVEDVFLVEGAALANQKTQLQIETDLLAALAVR